MARPLDTADFRAIRIVLEPDDFAVSNGKPDRPTNLVDKETWHGIVDLPDDVSIRISNHQGAILKELYALQSTWTSHAIGDDQHHLDTIYHFCSGSIQPPSGLPGRIHG